MTGRELVACDRCDADHEFVQVEAGVTMLRIMHDDDCPVLIAHDKRAGRV